MTLVRKAQRKFNDYKRVDNELTQELSSRTMVCYNPNEDTIELVNKSGDITELEINVARSLRKYLNRVFDGE